MSIMLMKKKHRCQCKDCKAIFYPKNSYDFLILPEERCPICGSANLKIYVSWVDIILGDIIVS